MIEDFQCTCGATGEEAADHSMACALWDDEEFASGMALWCAEDEELIYLDPGTSLHDEMEQVVGEPPEDKPDEWELPVEVVTFEEACQAEEEGILLAWNDADEVPKNYTLDGVSRVWNPDVGAWETKELKCHCDEPDAGPNLCLHCQVWRPGEPKGKPKYYGQLHWRPTTTRDGELLCSCDPPMMWNCGKCLVTRHGTDEPWQVKKFTEGGATNVGWAQKTFCRHPGKPLVYPNGLTLYGSSHSGEVPDGFKPDFAIYLDKIWTAKTLAIQVPWPDMSIPGLEDEHIIALVELIGRMIAKGQTIEVGCIGGHGRTGTLLAIVGLENGIATPQEAVNYVREHYCSQAIESLIQEWYVEKYFAVTRGLEVPDKPKTTTSSNWAVVARGSNKGKLGKKKNDTNGIWYCSGCAKDAWDQDDACWWCECTFDNPGVRPLEEWNPQWTKFHEGDAKTRIVKATLKLAEAKHGLTTLKVVTSTGQDPVDVALDKLGKDSSTPHIRSRLPFPQEPEKLTMALLGQMRATQPFGTLTTFEHKGRTYIPTKLRCDRCQTRIFYKVRYANEKTGLKYRQEMVHADDLTKITRCKRR